MSRFLVVDADAATVRGLALLLTGDGHEVTCTSSLAVALALLSRETFDAVMTDIDLPDGDGCDVVRAARGFFPHACIMVVSARAAARWAELKELGVCITAEKPLDYARMIQTLEACRRRARVSGHSARETLAFLGAIGTNPLPS